MCVYIYIYTEREMQIFWATFTCLLLPTVLAATASEKLDYMTDIAERTVSTQLPDPYDNTVIKKLQRQWWNVLLNNYVNTVY